MIGENGLSSNFWTNWKKDLALYLLAVAGIILGIGLLALAEYRLGLEVAIFSVIVGVVFMVLFVPAWIFGVLASGNPHNFSETGFAVAVAFEGILILVLLVAVWLAGRWIIKKRDALGANSFQL